MGGGGTNRKDAPTRTGTQHQLCLVHHLQQQLQQASGPVPLPAAAAEGRQALTLLRGSYCALVELRVGERNRWSQDGAVYDWRRYARRASGDAQCGAHMCSSVQAQRCAATLTGWSLVTAGGQKVSPGLTGVWVLCPKKHVAIPLMVFDGVQRWSSPLPPLVQVKNGHSGSGDDSVSFWSGLVCSRLGPDL